MSSISTEPWILDENPYDDCDVLDDVELEYEP
jgi:hypothetical protein